VFELVHMKKITWIVSLLVIAVILLVVFNTRPKPQITQDNRTIVAILPLSGPIAYTGELAKRGIDMAVDDLATSSKVKIIFEDAKNDPKLAVSIFNKYIVGGKESAYIALGSPIAMSLLPLANTNKVVLMSLASAPAYISPDGYTFKLSGSADVEMANILENVDKFGIKRLAVIYQNDDYGRGLMNSLKSKYKGTLVAEEGFLSGSSDVRTELTKIKAAKPDGIFVATYAPTAGVIAKQASTLGIESVFMCGSACDISDLVKSGGASTEGFIVTTPTSVTLDDLGQRYKNKYNEEIGYVTTRNYDAVMMIAAAMDSCTQSSDYGTCLKTTIHSAKDFPGTSFLINFDNNGNINDRFVVKKVVNGVLKVQ
jgi:branched-chain amino acid transport system substrate-binding protein